MDNMRKHIMYPKRVIEEVQPQNNNTNQINPNKIRINIGFLLVAVTFRFFDTPTDVYFIVSEPNKDSQPGV